MIRHIVIWRLKEKANGNSKQKNAQMIKQKLEALQGEIPGMRKIEVGIDFSLTPNSGDVALYSEFVSKEALAGYQNHPAHKAIMPFILEARSDRYVVDYEV